MSIKNIAAIVGVSPATVSRVLNNPGYRCQTPGLRDRIWRVAIEQNYSPNEAARNLKKGISAEGRKTYYINVLVTRMDISQSDPFFTELLHVIESEIHKQLAILSKVWYKPVFSDNRKCRRENVEQLVQNMYEETEGKLLPLPLNILFPLGIPGLPMWETATMKPGTEDILTLCKSMI